jgi:hypothetical protein
MPNRPLNLKPLKANAPIAMHRLFVQFQYANVDFVVCKKHFFLFSQADA